jgi:hypothetical protein
MILALSLSSDVKSIGAYAGFAAIIGLALLVILYFAQARETRRLSDALEEHEARLRRAPPPTAAVVARPLATVAAPTPLAPPRPAAAPVAGAPAAGVPASPPTATVAVPGARRVAVTPAATIAAMPAATEDQAGETVTDVRPLQDGAATAPATPAAQAGASTIIRPAKTDDDAEAAGEPVADASSPSGDPAPPAEAPDPSPETPPSQAETAKPVAVSPDGPPASIPPAATAAGAAAAAVKPDLSDTTGEEATTVRRAPATARSDASGKDEPGEETTTVRPAAVPLVARPAATAEPIPAADRAQPDLSADDSEAVSSAGAPAEPPRPRYPPAPGERAVPVGATARIAGGGDGPTATLRRDRRPDSEEEHDDEGHHRLGSRGTLRLLAVAIVLVGVLIFVANQLLSGSSPSHPAPTGPVTSSGPAPATITVAVLNGTSSSGLASRVSSTLVSDGFKPGAINNAPSNHLAKTTVEYIHHADFDAALEVAHDLQLTSTQVTRANAATIAAATIAGRVPSVIAVIGTNYAQ